MRDHGFNLADYYKAFVRAGIPQQFDLGINRLCSGQPAKADEGYAQLLANAPSLTTMQEFFQQRRDEFERESAKVASKVISP